MDRICKNCRLFDHHSRTCAVRLVNGTEVIRDVPVDPYDTCLWEDMGLAEFIREVRFWVEDPTTGEKTDGNGQVKIQYPSEFFGEDKPNIDES